MYNRKGNKIAFCFLKTGFKSSSIRKKNVVMYQVDKILGHMQKCYAILEKFYFKRSRFGLPGI